MLLAACSGEQPGAKSVSLAEVDRDLGQLTAGSASLFAPLCLTLNSPAMVRLQVAADAAQLDSRQGVGTGLASRMRATFAAPDLEVHPIAPELQAVSYAGDDACHPERDPRARWH